MKKTARIAGILYLLQIPLGIFGILYIPESIVVPDNLPATVSNILNQEFLFRLSIVSALICSLVTIATAVYLCQLLKPVHKTYARAIVLFTILAAPITMINELNHIAVLLLAQKYSSVSAWTMAPENAALFSLFLELHSYGVQITGLFFGLWLLPMGYLVIRSKYIPAVIGYFLLLTCLGYLVDFTNYFLFPQLHLVVSEYTWVGEVMMVMWLLLKGVKQIEYDGTMQHHVGKN
jgi:hypothetical protein